MLLIPHAKVRIKPEKPNNLREKIVLFEWFIRVKVLAVINDTIVDVNNNYPNSKIY